MSKRIGVVLADVHVGAIPPSQIWRQFQYAFLSYVEKMEQLDFIVIAGDFFDYKLYLNSPHAEVAVRMMTAIYNLAKMKGAKVRVVYGTESHESNQYIIFDNLTKDHEVDFKVITTAREEQLFEDTKVLYLPEEFVHNKHEAYKDFFEKEKEYDYIFGHGVIQEVMTTAVRHSDKKSNRAKPPVFTTADLSNMCKGQCFFGHYHINVDIGDGIYYVGSFTRWQFGEEEPKGFYVTEQKGSKYKARFVVNDYADRYCTAVYKAGGNPNVFINEEEFIREMESLSSMASMNDDVHIRIILNIPEDLTWANFITQYVKDRFVMEDRIKVNIINGYMERKDLVDQEQLAEIFDTYDFIFDRDLKLEDKCVQFIKLKFDKSIPVERMKDILYKEIEV